MREILFRAKSDGIHSKWVYGFYEREVFNDGVDHILTNGIYDGQRNNAIGESYCVLPETIGQYTGMADKNGINIFEGDILKNHFFGVPDEEYDEITVVEMVGGAWIARDVSYASLSPEDASENLLLYTHSRSEIIGNIHDNPELLA